MLWLHPAITLGLWALYLASVLTTFILARDWYYGDLMNHHKSACIICGIFAILTMLALTITSPIPMEV